NFLVLQQSFGLAFSGVPEGAPGARDVVEPGMQARRNGEVVHRGGDHNDVRCLNLVQQSVATFGNRVLTGSAMHRRRRQRGKEVAGQVGYSPARDIPLNDFQFAVFRPQSGNKLIRDGGGSGIRTCQTRFYEEQVFHWLTSWT